MRLLRERTRQTAWMFALAILCVVTLTRWNLQNVVEQEQRSFSADVLRLSDSLSESVLEDTGISVLEDTSLGIVQVYKHFVTETQTYRRVQRKGNISTTDTIRQRRKFLDGMRMLSEMDGRDSTVTSRFTSDVIFWSENVESWIPKGIGQIEADTILKKSRNQRVASLEPATTQQCGRPQNAVITLEDGTMFCARHRHNNSRSILGELLAYYLSHFLGMDNVPPVSLSQVNCSPGSTWAEHADHLRTLEWSCDIFVALIGWVGGLNGTHSSVQIPSLVAEALKSTSPLNSASLSRHLIKRCASGANSTCGGDHIAEVLSTVPQWSTMVVFDYLAANYDRAASHLDTSITTNTTIRNLRQTSQGKLWLVDNEAAFFISYQLLHQGSKAGEELGQAHSRLLRSICIFQRHLVTRLMKLAKSPDPARMLEGYVRMHEPLYNHVRVNRKDYWLFRKFFRRRVKDVVEWIQKCRSYTPEV